MDLTIPQPGEDLTQGSGYDKPSTKPVIPILGNITEASVESIYPETTAIGIGSGISISSVKLTVRMDKGWNAWARSIEPLQAGYFFQATLPEGVEAAFFALGVKDSDGLHISSFQHGLMIDTGGITVRERGLHKTGLKSPYSLSSKVKIFRDESGMVVYVVTTGTETKFYKSLVDRAEHSALPLYIYCYLYSGGDRVETNEFIAGRVQFASV